MKWIKIAIEALIAVSLVPFVVLSVLGKGENEEIIYTISLDYFYAEDGYIYEWSGSTFNEIIDYLENEFTITNLYDNTNDINITITNWSFNIDGGIEMFDNNSIRYELARGIMYINKTYDSVYSVNAENLTSLDITITKSIYKDNLITMLLSFASIVFVGGVLFYFYKPFKEVTGR